ncbi:MAG: UDP-N-acetylglucosamine--N-acetylmuramyl-(pentapeptide) pyrophosphoryl-undecaprenol N-acetylglucosamine transferase [Holosporales bacterium]|jgi:UDP-N-acetylglucosamine--N-acetylmuramyl-(pentapeptide) pyrophosphoryl-undecaprenol N-acetylglucosamine transferase|nr:UDP-N-acetylglucosamine--N-acetylmuramyl-(pentapeptide) pyrophosphoryl-undecaprenol N-acetylglucosamine transferase [Holosporales bacterium]
MRNDGSCGRGADRLIFIAAGGTGGHVFPAICLAKALERRPPESGSLTVVFCTDTRGARYVSDLTCKVLKQKISTTSRMALYVSLIFNTIKSIVKLRKLRPSVVVGFGGYPSIPYVLAAQLLGIKTAIHEQNAVLGLANRLLSYAATVIMVSFPQTAKLRNSRRSTCVGNPSRFEESYRTVKSPNNGTFTILVFGGSQGSRVFAYDVAPVICKVAHSFKMRVFHQCRPEHIDEVERLYVADNVDHTISDFFDDIDLLYGQADLVISRAGASSIFEIIGFRKPSILIPFKGSINGDQAANAKFLLDREAAFVLNESDTLQRELEELILAIINDRSKLDAIASVLQTMDVADCTQRMVRVIEEVAEIGRA